jgi:hypothetical protein
MVDIDSIITPIITGVVTGASVFFIQRHWTNRKITEKEMFWQWNRDFDRPAFHGYFVWDSSQEMYIGTIDDLIRSINTGKLERGVTAPLGHGRTYIKNKDRRQKMGEVVKKLTRIKSTVSQAEHRLDEISKIYYTQTENKQADLTAEKITIKEESKLIIDTERNEIIKILNSIWTEMGIPTMLPIDVTHTPSKPPNKESQHES